MAKYHKHSKSEIQDILREIVDPFEGGKLFVDKSIDQLKLSESNIKVMLERAYPMGYAKKEIDNCIKTHLAEKLKISVEEINLTLDTKSTIVAHSQNHAVKAIPNVANIIAISSGKGGVGKSTVAANLALSLKHQGASVGLLDADIYGPSQPNIFNLNQKPEMQENMMLPIQGLGIELMSIGFMIDQETPMIWRGPMVTQALEQMLRQTRWSELDYLILDLPPGTGDVQLTLAQKTPLAGSVVVTTPQDLALLDVKKAINMFEKVEVPILGVVENMSSHICSQCQHEEAIFGKGGGEKLANEAELDFLGSLPLDIAIRKAIDAGLPTVAKVHESNEFSAKEQSITNRYHDIALSMAIKLASRKKDYRSLFPKIEIANT